MLYNFQIQVFFLFIAASVADAVAVKRNITNILVTDFNKGNPGYNGAKSLENPPFFILVNCAFENLMPVDG